MIGQSHLETNPITIKPKTWAMWQSNSPRFPYLLLSTRVPFPSKHVYYLGWNRSPVQVGCMKQVLGPGALGWPRGMGWRGRWEGGSGWGTHVNPWLIHVNVWQKLLQYCKVISLQLIKINEKKNFSCFVSTCVSSDSSFPSVRQEPSFGPWKGSPFLQQF